jgi:iron complex outermembrane recepter protein
MPASFWNPHATMPTTPTTPSAPVRARPAGRARYLVAWSLGALVPLGAGAGERQVTLAEADLLGPIPQLSIVSHFPQTAARAPASTTVITADMLRAAGAMNWVDVFRLVPGFQAYAVNANRFGISYHGQGRELPNHLEVMVDGRSVYDPIQSTVVWGALGIDLEDVERIEIVRGPSAAAHGSNAFAGAVNIITRAPVQDDGTRARVTGGDRATRQVWVRHSDQTGNFDYRLSLGFDHNRGFPNVNAFGPDDGAETWNAHLRTTFTPTLADTLSFDAGFSRHDTEFGDADRVQEYVPIRYYNQFQRFAWERQLAGGRELQTTFYRNHLRANGVRDFGLVSELTGLDAAAIPLLFGIPDQHYTTGFHTIESERLDLEAVYRGQSPQVRWAWGAGARQETIDSVALIGDRGSHDEQLFRLFAHGEWQPFDRWSISAGAMAEKTPVGILVSPRVSAARELWPDQTLRLTAARGRRSPSISEARERQLSLLDGLVVDDVRRTADLDDERIDSLDLAYLARFPELGIDFDIKLFREEISDGIDDYREPIAPLPPFFDDERLVRDNFSSWDTTGIELQLFYRLTERDWVRLHYACQDLDSRYVNQFEPTLELKDFDGGTPRHSGGLLFNHRWTENLDSGFFVYRQSGVDWRNGNPIGAFTRVDAQTTWRFRVGSSRGQLQLVAQNLGGDYHEFNRENRFETAVYLHARVDLPN